MSTVAFDTYKAVKALRSAGFNDSQAEAVTEQIGAAISEGLATTGDIQSMRSELKGDIQALEGKIQTIESRLTVKLYSALALAVALIKALDYFLSS